MLTVKFKSERAKIKSDPTVNAMRAKFASKKPGKAMVRDNLDSETAASAKRFCRTEVSDNFKLF
jgi:hypothetical protein